MKKYSVSVRMDYFRDALKYLMDFIHLHKSVGICDALRLLQAIIKNHFKNDSIPVGIESMELITLIGLLLKIINDPSSMQKSTSCLYDGDPPIEIKSSAVFCLEAILTFYEKLPQLVDSKRPITSILLQMIYAMRFDESDSRHNYCAVMRSALSSLRYIAFDDREWCTEHLGELLGVCRANMLFGLPGFVYQPAQKVQSSQQAMCDVSSVQKSRSGGKGLRNRRPRQVVPPKLRRNGRAVESSKVDEDSGLDHPFLMEHASTSVMHNMTTSDSEPSDAEGSQADKKNREKDSKLRLASLTMLTILARVSCRAIIAFTPHFLIY